LSTLGALWADIKSVKRTNLKTNNLPKQRTKKHPEKLKKQKNGKTFNTCIAKNIFPI
jgi:hypothetical protein